VNGDSPCALRRPRHHRATSRPDRAAARSRARADTQGPGRAGPPLVPPSPVALDGDRGPSSRRHAVTCVVLGCRCSCGEHARRARGRAFAAALRARVAVPVELWDERFTSTIAEQSLPRRAPRAGAGAAAGASARAPRTRQNRASTCGRAPPPAIVARRAPRSGRE